MLSIFSLIFGDREMRLAFEREKKAYYRRILLVVWPLLITLAALLIVLDTVYTDFYSFNTATHFVNGIAAVLFFVIWLFVKKQVILSWFVCPLMTAFAFYYFAVVDYDGSVVSIYYTLIVGITLTFFILVVFNENWVLSSVVYAPLLTYYMKKTGDDMLEQVAADEFKELVVRCLFCILMYTIVAYKVESLNKRAFLGQQTSDKAFYRWLKIFETFPEGLALLRKNKILYANQSFAGMFEMRDYEASRDPYNEKLNTMLKTTTVTRLGKEEDIYSTTAWGFIDHYEKGAPFSFNVPTEQMQDDNPEMQKNNDGSFTKYISMNKVNVNVAGMQDKLFVVRDLNSMVNLQKLMYTKKHFNVFTEKIVKQIQEASGLSLINLEKLDNHLDRQGREISEETLNETKRILHRILDYEQVYNISEGGFAQPATNFNIKDIFEQVQSVTESDFRKRNILLVTKLSEGAPKSIRATHLIFRQVILNLLNAVIAGSVRNTVEIIATGGAEIATLTVEIKSYRNELTALQCHAIEELCLEEELVRILEAVQDHDLNLVIALILSRQLGWPIDFSNNETTCSFVMVLPTTPYGAISVPVQPAENNNTETPLQANNNSLSQQDQSAVSSHPPLRMVRPISVEEMHKEVAEVAPISETPLQWPTGNHPDCLLVSCSDLVPFFEKNLGFRCDESFLEESAINAVSRSIRRQVPYRFVFVDLDDPTLLLGRFMSAIKKQLEGAAPGLKIDVYACASTSSERMLKKCSEVQVKFIAKPLTMEKVAHLGSLYRQ